MTLVQRELEYWRGSIGSDEDDPEGQLVLTIGVPERAASYKNEWSVLVRLSGLGEPLERTAHGHDSLQALLLGVVAGLALVRGLELRDGVIVTFLGSTDLSLTTV
jgi:hypothetical protein